jgi:hypothetical protein
MWKIIGLNDTIIAVLIFLKFYNSSARPLNHLQGVLL